MTASFAAAAALAAAVVAGAGADRAPAEAPFVVAGAQVAMTDSAEPAAVLDESATSGDVKVGDRVEIRLKAQFGTGFSWALAKPPEGALKLLGDAVVLPEGTQAPEGGFETQVFSFEAAAPGEAALDFVYRRPWQPDDPTNKHAGFTVKVSPK